jgi:MFS family permease
MESLTLETSRPSSRLSWAAIFAGAAVALAVWLILHLLGIGVGLTAIDPDDASSLHKVGIGTGIWSAIAPLVGLFVGGWVSGLAARPMNRRDGVIHGAVAWAIATISSMIILMTVIVSLAGTVLRTGGEIASGVAQAAGHVVGNEHQARAQGSQITAHAEEMRHDALQAAETTGKGLVALAIAFIAGLVAAIAGAVIGAHRPERRGAESERRVAERSSEPRPIGT